MWPVVAGGSRPSPADRPEIGGRAPRSNDTLGGARPQGAVIITWRLGSDYPLEEARGYVNWHAFHSGGAVARGVDKTRAYERMARVGLMELMGLVRPYGRILSTSAGQSPQVMLTSPDPPHPVGARGQRGKRVSVNARWHRLRSKTFSDARSLLLRPLCIQTG